MEARTIGLYIVCVKKLTQKLPHIKHLWNVFQIRWIWRGEFASETDCMDACFERRVDIINPVVNEHDFTGFEVVFLTQSNNSGLFRIALVHAIFVMLNDLNFDELHFAEQLI